ERSHPSRAYQAHVAWRPTSRAVGAGRRRSWRRGAESHSQSPARISRALSALNGRGWRVTISDTLAARAAALTKPSGIVTSRAGRRTIHGPVHARSTASSDSRLETP